MSATVLPLDQPRSRWRFTIAGLMVCMLGIAVGLATSRLPNAHWFDGLLGAFFVWYTIGCWRQAAALARSTALHVDADDLWTIRLAIGIRAIAPLVVACGIALHLGRRSGLEALKFGDFAHSQALEFVSTGLILLPVLALLPQMSQRQITAPRRRFGKLLSSILGIVAVAALSLVIGANLMLVTVLVHIAIHGVRQVQPFRRHGVQFDASAFDPDATRLFNWGAVAAVILWFAAVACLWRFARGTISTDAPARRQRVALAIIMAVTMAALACLVVAGGRLFVTQISPFLGRYIWIDKPPLLWWLALLFLATAACWLTAMLLRVPCDSEATNTFRVTLPSAPLLHDWLLVLSLPAVWWACNLIETIQTLGSLMREMPGLLFGDVSTLLLLAYCLSWVHVAWRQWKGHDASRLELARVSPWHVAAVWLGCAAIIAVGGPVAAWISFALWTWPT